MIRYDGLRSNDQKMADEKKAPKEKANLYQAEYLGSGTFNIVKPKRNPKKTHEARVHDTGKRARRHGA